MKTLTLLLAFTLTGLIVGCGQNGISSTETGGDDIRQGTNFTFHTSEEMYSDLINSGTDNEGEDFEIVEVKRTEENGVKYLQIKIVHHACDPDPNIVWDGRILESHPPQVFLVIQLLAAGSCPDGETAEEQTEIFLVDLYDLLGDEYSVEHAVFTVRNASSESESKCSEDDNCDAPMPWLPPSDEN